MDNALSIPDQVAALSAERIDWLKTRANALVGGVFRAVGMPTERGMYRLMNVFAETHSLSEGERYVADGAILDALVKLEKKGHRCEPSRAN